MSDTFVSDVYQRFLDTSVQKSYPSWLTTKESVRVHMSSSEVVSAVEVFTSDSRSRDPIRDHRRTGGRGRGRDPPNSVRKTRSHVKEFIRVETFYQREMKNTQKTRKFGYP